MGASADNDRALKDLSSRLLNAGKQVRFSGIVALTRTAVIARKAVQEKMAEVFTLRNTWSQRSVAITPASTNQREPFAEVFVRDHYLKDQELGAERRLQIDVSIPFKIYEAAGISNLKVIPKKLRASQLTLAQKALAKGNKPFIQRTKSGKRFIFIRTDRARYPMLPLYTLEEEKEYKIKPRPFFFDTVQKAVDDNLELEYNKAFDQYVLRVK